MERKHPLANCEVCPLFEMGTYVPSVGPEKTKLAIVGEAPSNYEVRAGYPFAGEGGKLLDMILKHHSMDRKDFLTANAVSCRLPVGDKPSKSAINACRPRIVSELQEAGVETVVVLGNTASESLLGKTGVTTLRSGPGKYSDIIPGIRIIPTVHPAAIMRQADQFPNIVADIGKVNYVPIIWSPPKFVVTEGELDALEFLQQLDSRFSESTYKGPRKLVIDIEVDVEKDTSFDIPSTYGILCVGIGYAPNRVLVLSEHSMESPNVRSSLGKLLRKYQIIAQNGKFDLKGLFPIVGALDLWFDTMLASYVFDERPGIHGLKYMAVEYLGAPQYDEEIKKYVQPGTGYGAIPKDLLHLYNATDVTCTWALWEMYEKKFETEPELRKVHDHLIQASNGLMDVELAGINIDKDQLTQLAGDYSQSLNKIELELNDMVAPAVYDDKLGGINPRSPLQVKAYLKDQGIVTDSTDVDTLELILSKKQLPNEITRTFVTTLLKHRGETKIYNTYIQGIEKRLHEGQLYPTFMLHGTTTGRLSCRNPNLQNIPRGSTIRQMFIPTKPENVFLQIDYSQAELRVLSFLAQDTYFRDIFNAGDRDVFDDLTLVLYPHVDKSKVSPAQFKEYRIRVKAFVYGLGYGREAASIAAEFEISMAEANTLRNNFFQVIPEIVQFQKVTRENVLSGGDLITPWGRHRRFPLITKQNRHEVMNEALAFLPQSTASDMCLQAMYRSVIDLKGMGVIRNIVHDSILVEGHPKDIEEINHIVSNHMIRSAEEIVNGYVKFDVDSKIGKDWSQV